MKARRSLTLKATGTRGVILIASLVPFTYTQISWGLDRDSNLTFLYVSPFILGEKNTTSRWALYVPFTHKHEIIAISSFTHRTEWDYELKINFWFSLISLCMNPTIIVLIQDIEGQCIRQQFRAMFAAMFKFARLSFLSQEFAIIFFSYLPPLTSFFY